jgi:hypothetical protein
MKEYTEEDLRQAFYKGREIRELPDGFKMFIRPTFMGYLRELDGLENVDELWQRRINEFNESTK